MSPALEKLVRPFQSGNIRPGSLTAGLPQTAPDAVVMMCGSVEGSSQFFNESRSESIDSYTEGQQQEVSRTVIPMRVKNPDDPEQHVEVDVTKSLTVASKDGEKVTKKETNFSDPVASATNEILGGARKITDLVNSPGGWPANWKGG